MIEVLRIFCFLGAFSAVVLFVYEWARRSDEKATSERIKAIHDSRKQEFGLMDIHMDASIGFVFLNPAGEPVAIIGNNGKLYTTSDLEPKAKIQYTGVSPNKSIKVACNIIENGKA